MRLLLAARSADPARTLLLPSDHHYVGDFDAVTGQPHGQGVAYDSAGKEAKSGEWQQGALHGQGQFTHAQKVAIASLSARDTDRQLTSYSMLVCMLIA